MKFLICQWIRVLTWPKHSHFQTKNECVVSTMKPETLNWTLFGCFFSDTSFHILTLSDMCERKVSGFVCGNTPLCSKHYGFQTKHAWVSGTGKGKPLTLLSGLIRVSVTGLIRVSVTSAASNIYFRRHVWKKVSAFVCGNSPLFQLQLSWLHYNYFGTITTIRLKR